MRILVTGARGFIGRNLIVHLQQKPVDAVWGFDRENSPAELDGWLAEADFIFHLAGVNRPPTEDEFQTGNVELTAQICDRLGALGKSTPLVLASSTQAELDNPYGRSKRAAEEAASRYANETGARVLVYRLTNVFGKWCRPHYNSVVATFCHNIARDLPIAISDPARELNLVHVDDVVAAFCRELEETTQGGGLFYRDAGPIHRVSLGQLAETLQGFRQMRRTLVAPDFSDAFAHKLYGTFLSYLEPDDFAYDLTQRSDPRGSLAEFIKSPTLGQIFVSRTKPGVTRGNHFHHVKAEKFLVLEGEAIIRFRHILRDDVVEYSVRGEDYRVLDIPTGYTHSIENVGQGDLITLFWASEVFDPNQPDTIWQEVLR